MGRVCAAVNCTSRQKKDSGISFHEFPHKRPEVLKQWLKNVRREKWFPSEKSSFLCSKHFLPDSYEGGRQTLRRLKDDAIPTIFDYTVKPRKKKLSPNARVKRLAVSPEMVITGSIKKKCLQKSCSKDKSSRRQYTAMEEARIPTSGRCFRKSLKEIENCLVHKQKNSMMIGKKLRKEGRGRSTKCVKADVEEVEHDDDEGEEVEEEQMMDGADNRVDLLIKTLLNGRKREQVRNEDLLVDPTKETDSNRFQMVTIIPSTVNPDGEVSYRLIVQDYSEARNDATEETTATSNSSMETVDKSSSETLRDCFPSQLPGRAVELDNESPEMRCTFCTYVTQKRYLLSRHLKAHLECNPHKCEVCPCSFKTLKALHNHINTHKGVRPFKCRSCEEAFTAPDELVQHVHKCHDHESNTVQGAGLNVVQGKSSPAYHCPHCQYAGRTIAKLKRHLVTFHRGEKRLMCDICDKDFISQKCLEAHLLFHLDGISSVQDEESEGEGGDEDEME